MNDMDRGLLDLTLAHRAFARYCVYLTKRIPDKGRTVVETGLTYDAAKAESERLMATLVGRVFGDPMYGMEMERDVTEAARPYWRSEGEGQANHFRPFTDLAQWAAVGEVPEGRVCQVLWRARDERQHQTMNFLTRKEAVGFARAKMAEMGDTLYDLGITPNQAIKRTEFAQAEPELA